MEAPHSTERSVTRATCGENSPRAPESFPAAPPFTQISPSTRRAKSGRKVQRQEATVQTCRLTCHRLRRWNPWVHYSHKKALSRGEQLCRYPFVRSSREPLRELSAIERAALGLSRGEVFEPRLIGPHASRKNSPRPFSRWEAKAGLPRVNRPASSSPLPMWRSLPPYTEYRPLSGLRSSVDFYRDGLLLCLFGFRHPDFEHAVLEIRLDLIALDLTRQLHAPNERAV